MIHDAINHSLSLFFFFDLRYFVIIDRHDIVFRDAFFLHISPSRRSISSSLFIVPSGSSLVSFDCSSVIFPGFSEFGNGSPFLISYPEWEIMEPHLPSALPKRKIGRPHASFRGIINTIVRILITGARWVDVPIEKMFGKRSTSHKWLEIRKSDGTWERMKAGLAGQAHDSGLIDWGRTFADGAFAAGKGGGEGVEYGFEGKGVIIHAFKSREECRKFRIS